jgi:hypothetical protein
VTIQQYYYCTCISRQNIITYFHMQFRLVKDKLCSNTHNKLCPGYSHKRDTAYLCTLHNLVRSQVYHGTIAEDDIGCLVLIYLQILVSWTSRLLHLLQMHHLYVHFIRAACIRTLYTSYCKCACCQLCLIYCLIKAHISCHTDYVYVTRDHASEGDSDIVHWQVIHKDNANVHS